MSRKKIVGIYKITNLTDGKSYIGQSINVMKRKNYHFDSLNKNKHTNPYLQNAFNIDKQANFTHELVTRIIVPEEMDYDNIILKHYLCLAEEHNIEWFDSRITGNGYNIREVAESNLGMSFYQSEDFKNKLRLANTGKHQLESTKKLIRDNSPDLSGENCYWWGKTGELSPRWGKAMCKRGCELFLKSPINKYYFVINNARFSIFYNLNAGLITQVVKGNRLHHRKWTGSYAPKWLVDKVKPLMKSGHYWVEIDEEGNILE